jgi:LacI family transcriptional regulator
MAQVRSGRITSRIGSIAHLTATYPLGDWQRMPFTRQVIVGATERADQLGYRLEEFSLKQPGLSKKRLTTILQARGIRGILIGKQLQPLSHLRFEWDGFAAASLGFGLQEPALHRVGADVVQGLRLAIRRLRRLGYRRIGLAIDDDWDRRNQQLYSAAFLRYQHSLKATDRVALLIFPAAKRAMVMRWYHRQRPQAVISHNDRVLNWLHRDGIAAPSAVGYVSLVHIDKAPTVSHIDPNPSLIGAAAIDSIVGQLQRNETGLPEHPQTILIPGQWRAGETVRRQRS